MMTAWPTWAHFEQFASIHNVEYATMNDGFAGNRPNLTIATAPFIRNLQRLLDAEKEGIFKYVGRDGMPSPVFYSGQAGITFDSSGIRGQLQNTAKFRYLPAYLPYDPEIIAKPINSIIGGASLWAMTAPHRSDAEYKAVAQFFAYMGQAGTDAAWSQATGYVPVTRAGYEQNIAAGYYKQNPGADLPVNQLARQPTTNYLARHQAGGDAADPHHHRGGVGRGDCQRRAGCRGAGDSAAPGRCGDHLFRPHLERDGFGGSKKAVAFLKKSDAKNFSHHWDRGAKQARPSLKSFCAAFFKKRLLSTST